MTFQVEISCRVTQWEFESGGSHLQPEFPITAVPEVPLLSASKATGGAAMSTGSAASDAEDYEPCHGRTAAAVERSARKITYYNPSRYSDEELEDDGVDGRIKQERKLSKAHQREARQSQRNAANARERARMRVLSKAFSKLKTSLPWVPADTKLSKLDTLRLASSYISHLRQLLQDDRFESRFAHPVNLVWRCNFKTKDTTIRKQAVK